MARGEYGAAEWDYQIPNSDGDEPPAVDPADEESMAASTDRRRHRAHVRARCNHHKEIPHHA